jgi:hypothetical protein
MRRTNTVPQYECHLAIPQPDGAVLIDLKGDDLATVKDSVQKQFSGGAEFLPSDHASGAGPALLIYHPDFSRGEVPLGWIQIIYVPETMTATATIEQRLQRARVA